MFPEPSLRALSSAERASSLADKLIGHSGQERGEIEIELAGEMANILQVGQKETPPPGTGPERRGLSSVVKVVAGAGFEPTTFRL